ncbi:citrate/2-methylcitrate synthase, partial [Staphylococcus epidermidis]|uniref:citrate/2-methylcitrate synthase n=1 Tax=Staphylococcus epidermidis TaxID=1282 RepID=UPI0037D9BA8A
LSRQLPTQLQLQPFNNPLILHPHHQLNPSPFTPPSTLSSLSHIYSRLLPPIPSLKPPLHPGPNQRLISILKEIPTIDNLHHYL